MQRSQSPARAVTADRNLADTIGSEPKGENGSPSVHARGGTGSSALKRVGETMFAGAPTIGTSAASGQVL